MAHHESTPQSVLNAPTVTEEVIHATSGLNREQRRRLGVRTTDNKPYARIPAKGFTRKQLRALKKRAGK